GLVDVGVGVEQARQGEQAARVDGPRPVRGGQLGADGGDDPVFDEQVGGSAAPGAQRGQQQCSHGGTLSRPRTAARDGGRAQARSSSSMIGISPVRVAWLPPSGWEVTVVSTKAQSSSASTACR